MKKNRKILSVVLVATMLCTMLPPASVMAGESGEAVNVQPVVEEVIPVSTNAKSGEGITIEGGTEGTDYTWDGNVLVIESDTELMVSNQLSSACSVRVPSGVNATLKLESGYVDINAISNGSKLSLISVDNGIYNKGCYLSDYEGTLEIKGAGSFNIETLDRNDKELGNLIINCDNQIGSVGIYVDEAWCIKNFIINSGRVHLYYYANVAIDDTHYDALNISTENFEIHGGDVDFELNHMTSYYTAISTNTCTIDGGSVSVWDNINDYSGSLVGVVGGDAEFGTTNDYSYNKLINASTYNITGGAFYEANLSRNTVYGCPISEEYSLEIKQASNNDIYGSKYAKYVVVPDKFLTKLSVSGGDYSVEGHVISLTNGTYTVSSAALTNDCIFIENGAKVILYLDGVKILNTCPAIYVGYNSDLTLVLNDGKENFVETVGELGHAAIETESNSNLKICGSGSLCAQGTAGGTGIGSGESTVYSASTINIEDGNISAQGGYDAAGIGGGRRCEFMKINISGGWIEAEGITGIGDGPLSDNTDIIITGGEINAHGTNGAGIGGGPGSTVNRIEIDDGVINAYSSSGAGIGSGAGYYSYDEKKAYNATIDHITINGGDIYANGSAGIGGGRTMNGALTSVGRIDIQGGTVEAYGNAYGIGAGRGGIGGTLHCNGAVIIADSISDMAHQEEWQGLFFVDTINHGQGTLMGDYVTLVDDYDNDRYILIKENQELHFLKNVVFSNRGSIDVQSGGVLFNEGTLNNEGSITVFSGATFNNDGVFKGNDVEYLDEEPQPVPDDTAVTGVQLNKKKISLQPGKSKKLEATVLPETAENKAVTWSSSDEGIAEVNKNGKVTAVNEGTAVITVTTSDGGYTAECTVTVSKSAPEYIAVTGVTLDKTSLSLNPGDKVLVTATVSPENATEPWVRVGSSNPDVAVVEDPEQEVSYNHNETVFQIRAIKSGTAAINVATVDGGFMALCNVTVSEKQTEVVAVENVKLNKTSLTLDIGESESLKATVTPEEAANKNVTWSSNDEDVASVDAKGKVTAISRGTATITVRTEDGNFAAQCKVTVTDPNATTTDTETQPDGSTVTTVEDVNGSSSSTIVDVNGVVNTSVTLSDSAVSDAAKNDTAVILPMVGVKASKDMASAPSVTVDLPGNTPVQVEIPVLDMTPGTVAVLVDKNGSKTILKNSVLGNNGLIVTLSDGETVKILDNTQTFSDVDSSHWAKNNIDYVTSRGLFVGTSASEFAPETPMSRAMIVSVLQRYEGDNTAVSPGEDWYEGARQWAMEAGISDGSDMMGNVTREQLVTMLYRYVGSPQMIGGLNSYSDVSSVSSYAEQAMVWAVRNGIIGGMTADTLAPQGMATRAQVAAILQRFIAWEQTA